MARRITLDEFIASRLKQPWGQTNAYVKEEGFSELYVRLSKRWLDHEWCDPVLDLANIKARWPGRGAFTKLIERLRRQYPHLTLYVESVWDQRFQAKLRRMGFKMADTSPDCFVLYADAHAPSNQSRQEALSSRH